MNWRLDSAFAPWAARGLSTCFQGSRQWPFLVVVVDNTCGRGTSMGLSQDK